MEWVNCMTICTYCTLHHLEASSVLESVFQSFVNSVSTPSVTKPYLWHMRLGYVFDNKLHALHSYLPDVHTFHSNKNCVLCPIAKQK